MTIQFPMVLACDIGNSYIHFGLFKNRRLVRQAMFATPIRVTPDECFMMAREASGGEDPAAMVIGSVVPLVTGAMAAMARIRYGVRPLIVSSAVRTGLVVKYRDPATIGADRIANAVAAWKKYKRDTVVVDFGTATTYDIVTKKGEYLGGIIVPGIGISLEALVAKTAKLFTVGLAIPRRAIGRNTEECIQAGIFYSTVGQVEAVVRAVESDTGKKFFVVATGGAASIFGSHIPRVDAVDLTLNLEGLLEINRLKR